MGNRLAFQGKLDNFSVKTDLLFRGNLITFQGKVCNFLIF